MRVFTLLSFGWFVSQQQITNTTQKCKGPRRARARVRTQLQDFLQSNSDRLCDADVCFPGGSAAKNQPAMQEPQEVWVQSLDGEDSLEEGMATPSSILAWRIPWTEESGGLQSTGLRRVGHD